MQKASLSLHRPSMRSRQQSEKRPCTYSSLSICRILLTIHRAPNESNPPPQFKLDIRNAPIQEEEGDADAVLASMANTLRAVCLDPMVYQPLLTST